MTDTAMTPSEAVIDFAKKSAAAWDEGSRRRGPITDDDVDPGVLASTLDAIAAEWPGGHDAGSYRLYLIHDLRDLAKALNGIATTVETWASEASE